jgi:hypothetical protein
MMYYAQKTSRRIGIKIRNKACFRFEGDCRCSDCGYSCNRCSSAVVAVPVSVFVDHCFGATWTVLGSHGSCLGNWQDRQVLGCVLCG